MNRMLVVLTLILLCPNASFGFLGKPKPALAAHAYPFKSQAPGPAAPAEISGMYTFLQDGEFVQVSVDAEGHVTGFISRYSDNEKAVFLDHFFDKALLQGNELSFTTKTVHGVYFEFHGSFGRGEAKSREQEGYYVLRGTLKQYTSDSNKNFTAQAREVTFKSFPQDAEGDGTKN
ncbi:MAG: hypothetical protein JO187_11820 [Acidobacteria bacterium]|nr:hypothetical protein [Acidobacteriota bacterium]